MGLLYQSNRNGHVQEGIQLCSCFLQELPGDIKLGRLFIRRCNLNAANYSHNSVLYLLKTYPPCLFTFPNHPSTYYPALKGRQPVSLGYPLRYFNDARKKFI